MWVFLARLKCKKCANVFEQNLSTGVILGSLRLGPYRLLKCPACGKSSWFNIWSSVKDSVTWPPEEKKQEQPPEPQLTEEEQEKKRIEESKYEKP